MKRYRRFGRSHMWWFRGFGLVEIVLSIAFPFVVVTLPEWTTTADVNTNTAVLTGISVLIALAAAVHGFFGWNDNWRLYKSQELVLLLIIRRWELALLTLSVRRSSDTEEEEAALAATREAIGEIGRALEHEQDVFFGTVRLPEELLKEEGQGTTPSPGGIT
ncbi:DUF4231 domain-containing protein [Nocardia pseudovaccinii]|uniref:DUF4231 domain-containing protein n=1 Tax=Nocardia pseudovaccinii TaxID=189540 RepID=UPI003D8F097D